MNHIFPKAFLIVVIILLFNVYASVNFYLFILFIILLNKNPNTDRYLQTNTSARIDLIAV